MKKSHFILLGVVSVFITIAYAEMPTPGGPPSLEFCTIPLEGTPTSEH